MKTKLKTCQKQNQRLQATVASLTDAVIALKEKHLVGENAYDSLIKCAFDVPFKWLRKKLTISENSREDYPEPLDNFAMTLLFYSPKPFHYICQVFNLLLPHESDGMQMLMGHQDSPISHSSSWKLKLLKKKVKTKMFLSNF